MGAKLARDEASTSTIFIDCNPAFASRLAPTLDLQQTQYPCAPGVLLWELSLLAMRPAHPPSSSTATPPSRAGSLPHWIFCMISGAPLTTMAERRHCGVGPRSNAGVRASWLTGHQVVGHERFGYFRLGRLPGFSKVTSCKSGTLSRRYRSNGYAHHLIQKKAQKKRRVPFLKKHRFLVTNTPHKAGLFHSRKNQNSGVYFTLNIRLRGSPKLLLPLSWL